MREDLCLDCGRVFPVSNLFRGGRRDENGDMVIVALCHDCLTAVNPYMQADLINAAFE